MKKNFFIFITIVVSFILLVGCSNEKEDTKAKELLPKDESYDLDLASKAESQKEVFEILERRNSEEFQVALAKLDNPIVQETLIQYDGIATEALMEICKNPHIPNINQYEIKDYFVSAIRKAKLTAKQEIEIAKTKEYVMQLGVLLRENLNAETLIYLLESNNVVDYTLNLDYFEHKIYIVQQIARIDFTLEQKKELLSLDIDIVNEALQEKEMKQ